MKRISIMDLGSVDLTKIRSGSLLKTIIMKVDTARGVHGVIGGASKASYQLYSELARQKGIKVDFIANFSKFTNKTGVTADQVMGKNYDGIFLNSMKDFLLVDEYLKTHPTAKTIYTDRANAIINRRFELGFHPRKVPINYFFSRMKKWLDCYVAITPEQMVHAREFFTSRTKISYIPIAPDKIYRKTGAKRRFNGALYVGRLDERQKKISFLLEGIAKVKQFNPAIAEKPLLKIVGEGPDAQRYSGMVMKLGLEKNVLFRGGLYGEDLVDSYNNAGFFVSTSEWESPGRSFLEAMACGLPVLANTKNNVVINPDNAGRLIVPNYNGMVYEYGDMEDFVHKFNFMLTNRHFIERAGKVALKYSKGFSLDKTLSGYKAIIKSL